MWEDTNIKVAYAMSALFGKRDRWMLKALCAGERNPQRLAARYGTAMRGLDRQIRMR
jgi:hypothetical protein